eukprot:15449988-Alexandrium_andersonii.AAC.1
MVRHPPKRCSGCGVPLRYVDGVPNLSQRAGLCKARCLPLARAQNGRVGGQAGASTAKRRAGALGGRAGAGSVKRRVGKQWAPQFKTFSRSVDEARAASWGGFGRPGRGAQRKGVTNLGLRAGAASAGRAGERNDGVAKL